MWRLFDRLRAFDPEHAPPGRHVAGRGLWFYRDASGAGHWEISLRLQGQTHERKLGDCPELSLKQARAAAAQWRTLARRGLNPAEEHEAICAKAARNLDGFYQ